MLLRSAQDRGFTLVELLMVVTIMIVLAGAMIPSFSQYLRNQNLKQAQERLKSDLRTIQNKAVTGALYDQTIAYGGTEYPVTHWAVRFVDNTSNYYYFVTSEDTGDLNGECTTNYNNSVVGVGTVARAQGSGSLPSDMRFKGSNGCIFFDFINGTATPSSSLLTNTRVRPIYFGYTANTLGNCRNVRFNTAGLLFNTNDGNCSCAAGNYANDNLYYTNCQ